MEREYVQLPPLPADLDYRALELIWRFTIATPEEQQKFVDCINMLEDGISNTEGVRDFAALMDMMTKDEVPSIYKEFVEVTTRFSVRVIRDSYTAAAYLYQKVCVEGLSKEEVSKESGFPVEDISVLVDYFNVRKLRDN